MQLQYLNDMTNAHQQDSFSCWSFVVLKCLTNILQFHSKHIINYSVLFYILVNCNLMYIFATVTGVIPRPQLQVQFTSGYFQSSSCSDVQLRIINNYLCGDRKWFLVQGVILTLFRDVWDKKQERRNGSKGEK